MIKKNELLFAISARLSTEFGTGGGGLLHKLAGIVLFKGLLRWFKSYLSHRRKRVESKWADVLAGVTQGSMLGPLLFLIYIKAIVNDIRSSIRIFVDDLYSY